MVAPSSGQPSHGLAMMVTTMVTTMVTITNLGYRGCVTDYCNNQIKIKQVTYRNLIFQKILQSTVYDGTCPCEIQKYKIILF